MMRVLRSRAAQVYGDVAPFICTNRQGGARSRYEFAPRDLKIVALCQKPACCLLAVSEA